MKDIHEKAGNIHDETKDIHNETKNILVRQSIAYIYSVLVTQTSNRKLQILKFWQGWNQCLMLGTRLVIMSNALLGLENLFSWTSCSGPRTLRSEMCFG